MSYIFYTYTTKNGQVEKTYNQVTANNLAYHHGTSYQCFNQDGHYVGEPVTPYKILTEGLICGGFHNHFAQR